MNQMRTLAGWIAGSLLLMAVAGLFRPAVSGPVQAEEVVERTEKEMVYELRTYTTVPGRLPALHARFRDHTMRLFEKHGMKNVIYWTPTDKPDTLIYVLAHESEEAARNSFAAFREDPEWQRARDESEKDGRIVLRVESQFLAPTEYSPIP
jgi:hypothetical protein